MSIFPSIRLIFVANGESSRIRMLLRTEIYTKDDKHTEHKVVGLVTVFQIT
jgi:hypothetical protein